MIKDGGNLVFANSQSKTVGLGGNVVSQFTHDYAPQIVGGLTLAANASLMLTANPFAMLAASVGMIGKIIMITYGNRKKQENGNGQQHFEAHGDGIGAQLGKITHPKDYPIESAFGMSALSSALMIGYGISGGGLTPIITEALSLALSAFVVAGDEKKTTDIVANADSLPFAHSKSHALAWCGKEYSILRHNPILTSAIVNTAINIGMIAGALIEGNPHLAIAGVMFTVSTLVQAFHLRKNDYNIDGTKGKESVLLSAQTQQKNQPITFAEREIIRRQETNNLELGLA